METTEIITLNPDNITHEHICCAIGNDKTNLAREAGLPAKKIRIDNLQAAQQVPYPTGLAGIYLNGKFLSYEITTAKGFEKLLRKHMA